MSREPMFTGDLLFLSNFDTTEFVVPALGTVRSGEHAFNALKTDDQRQRDWILQAGSPGEAKRRGRSRSLALNPGWDNGVRVRAMQTVLVAKFAVPELRERLVGTGLMSLVETNHWHDQFWGSCFCARHDGTAGTNMLGELLMALRARHAS